MTNLSLTCSCCGHVYELPEGLAVAACPACGTANARPAAEGPSLEMLRHAVRQRLSCDFHNAERSYQQVLLYHPDEHEALWGRLLCHYGVEYVEDPATKRRMPVVHTVRNKPLRSQPEFQTACNFAPPEVAARYQEEAAYIDEAQMGIRLLAESCPPYDVFLCHKTTVPGSSAKTEDFHRAFQLYVYLREQGVRAFFAPECLTAVAGADYEAGIYHAIHTAKVMLVVCSQPEWLTSPWVRSEWSRYLSLMDEGRELRLVPLLYDHFDASKYPAEFRMRKLQGLTMGELDSKDKLMDIVRTVVPPPVGPTPDPGPTPSPVTAPLLQRAHMFLEDGDWAKADEYAEKVLDAEPQNAGAYVVKLLVRCKAAKVDDLRKLPDASFEQDGNYQKALRFGDAALKKQLTEAGEYIRKRKAERELADRYGAATQDMHKGHYVQAEKQFRALGAYQDAAALAEKCRTLEEERIAEEQRQKAERQRKEQERREAERQAREAEQEKRKARPKWSTKRILLACCAVALVVAMAGSVVRLLGVTEEDESVFAAAVSATTTPKSTGTPAATMAGTTQSQYKVGDIVTFGEYNGQALTWQVLEVKNGKALLLAEKSVADMPYNEEWDYITWAECTLRDWLNDDFLNEAFSATERKRIATTTVIAEDNKTYNTEAGENTDDRVFLLSISEAEKYLSTNAARICYDSTGKARWWWLRSPGGITHYAAGVSSSGAVGACGLSVYYDDAVRPALWLNLGS